MTRVLVDLWIGRCRTIGNERSSRHPRRVRRATSARLHNQYSALMARAMLNESDGSYLLNCVHLAANHMGQRAPHPNAACIIVKDSRVISESVLYANGTKSPEEMALEEAGDAARGSVVYVNLEPGLCHGDNSSVRALIASGVKRVVIGVRNPLGFARGTAISDLQSAGIHVDVLEDQGADKNDDAAQELANPSHNENVLQDALNACIAINEAFRFRAASGLPFSVLKYAMTLDGKIAASTGHAAWVTSLDARRKVYEVRRQSDAVIVGGNTVRRDNPRLTTRREDGHHPARIVLSRSMDLPENANLWDVSQAPTIVCTQKGARKEFQNALIARGVEVVEFEFLSPRCVMEYCAQRGFLQCLWECGGNLAAPAIASGVIDKVMAFVAPKIIGGMNAPTPVGELGFVQMTQAIDLSSISFSTVGPDILISGYFNKSAPDLRNHQVIPFVNSVEILSRITNSSEKSKPTVIYGQSPTGGPFIGDNFGEISESLKPKRTVKFFKTWDRNGALSNYSPHSVVLPDIHGTMVQWPTVEHYYQAQKFAPERELESDELQKEKLDIMDKIRSASSPEEASEIGRHYQRIRPELVSNSWDCGKMEAMRQALRCKFATHAALRDLLLSTGHSLLIEASPRDSYWGYGCDQKGQNHLGRLLMELRDEMKMKAGCVKTDIGSNSVETFSK